MLENEGKRCFTSSLNYWSNKTLESNMSQNAMPIGAGSQLEFRDKDLDLGQRRLPLIHDHPGYSLQRFPGRQNECYGDEAERPAAWAVLLPFCNL